MCRHHLGISRRDCILSGAERHKRLQKPEILRRSRSASERLDIGAAVKLGIKAGGLAVANMGSMDSIPWRDEIYTPNRTFTAVSPFEFDEEA